MARARNLKPSFFTNEVLADVPPLGRLLFQGLWCHADREGRLEDRPKRLKAEVLPYDDCDVEVLLNTLHLHGFILRYSSGDGRYIQVLAFTKHQNPHVKEAPSSIPAPDEHRASTVQAPEDPERAGPLMGCFNPQLGSLGVVAPNGAPTSADEASATKTGKATRLPDDWVCPPAWLLWAQCKRNWSPEYVLEVALAFRNHWTSLPGKDGRKLHWERTWQNWVMRQRAPPDLGVRDVRSRNMAILTGKVREGAINGVAERVGGATVLSLPGELREQDGDDVGGSRPPRSAAGVG